MGGSRGSVRRLSELEECKGARMASTAGVVEKLGWKTGSGAAAWRSESVLVLPQSGHFTGESPSGDRGLSSGQ